MRTLIFSTNKEAQAIQRVLGGVIIDGFKDVPFMIATLDADEDAIVICIGNVMVMGWSTRHPAHVLFSQHFPGDERHREQARGRVRPA